MDLCVKKKFGKGLPESSGDPFDVWNVAKRQVSEERKGRIYDAHNQLMGTTTG
jgi:hypothetical protein